MYLELDAALSVPSPRMLGQQLERLSLRNLLRLPCPRKEPHTGGNISISVWIGRATPVYLWKGQKVVKDIELMLTGDCKTQENR
jgi:hypothetical protein